jgi:hypothetical protein
METITINVSKTVTEKKEIALPLYRIDNCHVYMVYSPERAIVVCYGLAGQYDNIGIVSKDNAFTREETRDCTRDEFLSKYNEVRSRLDLIVMPPDRFPFTRHNDLADEEAASRAVHEETEQLNNDLNFQTQK